MMLKRITGAIVLSCAAITTVMAQGQMPDRTQQIKAAVSAAPKSMQQEATVLGYTAGQKLAVLREGEGALVCLADDPEDSRFHVACYYKELEPFMKRGRELKAAGRSREEISAVRQSEIESGALKFPDKPMALYSLTGPEDGFDYSKGVVRKANALRVVYVPYATVESTGIAGNPAGPGGPWLMDPGKPWAHIMIPGSAVGTESK